MDLAKAAHDLTILYIQAEIKAGIIEAKYEGNTIDFVSEYKHRYSEILDYLQNP